MPDTIPSRTSDKLDFFQNASDLLTANPTDYGFVAGDATAFAALLATAVAANEAAVTARNAAASATVALQEAMELLEADFRVLAQQARVNEEVNDDILATIGVFRRLDPAPIPAPNEAPIVAIERLNVGSATVWLQQTGGVRGRPAGAIGAEVSLVNGAAAAVEGEADIGQKRFSSKARFNVSTDIEATRIRMYARWMTARGLYSPWSLATTFTPQT